MALALTAGCVSIHPEVDQRHGDAVTAANRAQTINPQGMRNPDAVSGIDGRAAKETMDRYVDSFKSPPPNTNVINIGGGLAGQRTARSVRPTMHSSRRLKRRQNGAVIVTVAFAIAVSAGLYGHRAGFRPSVRGEDRIADERPTVARWQQPRNSTGPDALTRATNAGITAGNLNKVNFQGAAAGFVDADITFSDSLIGPTVTFRSVREREIRQMHAHARRHGAVDSAGHERLQRQCCLWRDQGVYALAVATRAPAQTDCALPIASCRSPVDSTGRMVMGAVNSGEPSPANSVGWTLRGMPAAQNESRDLLKGEGQCNLPGTIR